MGCPRPCIYYPVGTCLNGDSCAFCHLPHPKRPVHLDKRRRDMLKGMPFAECAEAVLPILREKLEALDLASKVRPWLETLEEVVAQYPALKSSGRKSAPKRAKTLTGALRAMTLRSLLTTLCRTDLPKDSPERAAVDALLLSLRPVNAALDV